jgi:hypothetical protein
LRTAAAERPFDAAGLAALEAARRAAIAPISPPPPPLLLAVSWLLRCGADARALLAALRSASAPGAIIAFEV